MGLYTGFLLRIVCRSGHAAATTAERGAELQTAAVTLKDHITAQPNLYGCSGGLLQLHSDCHRER